MESRRNLRRQLADLQRRYAAVCAERDEARQRADGAQFVVRRLAGQVTVTTVSLGWLLRSYGALARIRPAYAPPARVVDTGTPGVDVTR
jgi:hypothetical protein